MKVNFLIGKAIVFSFCLPIYYSFSFYFFLPFRAEVGKLKIGNFLLNTVIVQSQKYFGQNIAEALAIGILKDCFC